jgi:hypothetical protein
MSAAIFTTVMGINFEKDFEGSSQDESLDKALTWIRMAPERYSIEALDISDPYRTILRVNARSCINHPFLGRADH